MRAPGPALAALLACLSMAARATAQTPTPRIELSGAALFTGGADFGSRPGTLTANDPGDPDYTLFKTSTSLDAGAGLEIRLGIGLTRTLSVEGAFSWARQTLTTAVTADAEGAPAATITQKVSSNAFGGDALVRLTSLGFASGRGVPFVLAGGGYFRQFDDRQMLTGSGPYVEAGAGLKVVVWRRATGSIRAISIRSDGRAIRRSGSDDPAAAGGSHVTWALAAGVSAGF